MKQFLELGGGLVLTGGILGIGVLARIVLLWYYGLLGHACKKLNSTKNGTVRYIREGLKSRLEKGIGIKSVAVYTENCMAERKFAGIRIGVWESIGMQTVLLAMLTGAVCSLGGVLWECEGKRILEMLFAAGGSAVVLMAMDLVFGIREKHRRTRICIREHIENVWLAGLGFAEMETGEKEAKKDLKESRRSEKSIKQKNVGKKRCKAEEEKRRLTEELLRERRQLEARQIAERKKSEAVTQSVPEAGVEDMKSQLIERSVEEAAATQTTGALLQALVTMDDSMKEDSSYESLLRDVLAEYLA